MSDALVLSLEIYAFAIFISLLVAVMIWVIVISFARLQESSREPPVVPVATPPAVPEAPVAAIAAAVYTLVGPHRIVRIRQASRGNDWKAEGRSSHHRSHNIPRRR